MVRQIIKQALKEDLVYGDITTNSLIPKEKKIEARIFSREDFVVCGINMAKQVFKALDKNAKIKLFYKDGDKVKALKTIIEIRAKARAILSAERVALNFLSHLSGVATLTANFVNKIKPYNTKILDTRKTLPGLRELEKYAVKCAGGLNHRFDLGDMVLIKDSHKNVLAKDLGLQKLVKLAKEENKRKKIEIEVENLKEFKACLKERPDIIMLDNMTLSQIKKAVKVLKTLPEKTPIRLEASGNISLKNVHSIAKAGVDFISVGELTHSPRAIDLSLEIIR